MPSSQLGRRRVLARKSFARQATLDVREACFGDGNPLTEDTAATLRRAAAASPPPAP